MKPPSIDTRSVADLIAQMKELAPYYTPEWRFTPDDPDPGTALFLMFADMFHDNIKRLNRVPDKNRIAFLNLLGVSLLPARPASTYVTFELNEGAPEPVYIPAGTELYASDPDGNIPFETEEGIMLTPAQLETVYVTSKKQDAIVRLPDSLVTGIDPSGGPAEPCELFRFDPRSNLQQHALLLAHDDLFTVFDSARVEVQLGNVYERYKEAELCRQLADPELTEWLYGSEQGWTPFDAVETGRNRIVLTKSKPGEIVLREENGHVGRWIQCRQKQPRSGVEPLSDRQLAMTMVAVKTEYADVAGRGGLEPDLLFYNDIEVDRTGFYPFGDLFAPYATFYIASREAFCKKGGLLTLSFGLKAEMNRYQPDQEPKVDWKLIMKKSQFDKPNDVYMTISQTIWEYWNGQAWVRLDAGKEAERVFYAPGGERVSKKLTFRCPRDLQPTFVNGQESYWIRARVLRIENAYVPNAVYLSPWLDSVALTYQYLDTFTPPEAVYSLNQTVYEDHTAQAQNTAGGFEPFRALDAKHPTLYLAFRQPPERGPVSVYVAAAVRPAEEDVPPWLEWEYLRVASRFGLPPEWAPLKLYDNTRGLHQSGTLRFSGPTDYAEATLFGTSGYWIRAVNRDDKYDMPETAVPVLHALAMNTVPAVQRATMPEEFPQPSEDEPSLYTLQMGSIVDEEIWVDETELWREEDAAALDPELASRTKMIRDSDGNLQQVWVEWQRVDNFADSGLHDRHYTIDRAYGWLRFGDGIHGKELPDGKPELVKAVYKVTQGSAGNVGPRLITGMERSIAYVGGVTNPVPAAGGCDQEALEDASARGPELVKHRGRAVTARDFEHLARQSYPNIARVRCLPNRNPRMERDVGAVTLVVLPKDGQRGIAAFAGLEKQVKAALLGKAPGLIAEPERIHVVPPVLIELSVTAVVAVEGMEAVLPTEAEAIARLTRFLDPLQGHFDGKGWDIGQQAHASVFYALLKSIRSIQFVEKLYVTVHRLENGRRIEIDGNRPVSVPNGIVVSGKHKVTVRAL